MEFENRQNFANRIKIPTRVQIGKKFQFSKNNEKLWKFNLYYILVNVFVIIEEFPGSQMLFHDSNADKVIFIQNVDNVLGEYLKQWHPPLRNHP